MIIKKTAELFTALWWYLYGRIHNINLKRKLGVLWSINVCLNAN